ncbi:3-methyl-2-oxobutanoate hydroxymethyltransferase [bacterium HR40]|nr:3-methyl-2-oxobutanoate hydroxymethyltransferase [bacterium HR40]
MSVPTRDHRATLGDLLRRVRQGGRLAMLALYDATFAHLAEEAGVDAVLVGDSLAQTVQGRESTLGVELDAILYHLACVARGCRRPFLLADLPFGSFESSPAAAFAAASRLLAAGAQMVKIEGGAPWVVETVRFLVERHVPVCGHLGLTPQAILELGGYRVQGRAPEEARRLVAAARDLVAAGIRMLVLECVPDDLAAHLTRSLEGVAVIGIGAGPATHGQVLVAYDALGLTPPPRPRFVRDFLEGVGDARLALGRFVRAVAEGSFPTVGESYGPSGLDDLGA